MKNGASVSAPVAVVLQLIMVNKAARLKYITILIVSLFLRLMARHARDHAVICKTKAIVSATVGVISAARPRVDVGSQTIRYPI